MKLPEELTQVSASRSLIPAPGQAAMPVCADRCKGYRERLHVPAKQTTRKDQCTASKVGHGVSLNSDAHLAHLQAHA